ncbi:hypothetical protein [Pseudomonas lopnurensis]|uniref:hypothetical protein n=1 Tax=Pseudomonas lopnurensis TaxID=1477517 RepID=UPI0028A970AF|nr:hypothetical protein [Pseudomonas lopnurensis]
MRTFKTIPERGDFGFQQLVGPHHVTGAAIGGSRGFFGLKLSKSSLFGSVRDEQGNIYSAVRSLLAPGGTPNPTRFYYLHNHVDDQNLRMDFEEMALHALSPVPLQSLENDTVRWTEQPDEEGAGWEITANGERLTWKEDGLFHLEGRLLAPGIQWYLPGVEWGTFYVSQLWDVSGVCAGRPVKGGLALDQFYMAEGGAIHFAKDLIVNNNKHVIWWSFITVYKDGSWDAGSFMVGHDHLGYAIFNNDKGELRATTDIEGEAVHKDGSYFLESAKIVLEGKEEWEFLPDPKGEMTDFVGGFPITAQQEGRWRRVGDTREPSHWLGWGESDRRNGSARNVFGSDIK